MHRLLGRELEFQSLFSWNLPSDSTESLGQFSGSGFNPCFRGTCPRTPIHSCGPFRPAGVSILVFVELALGLGRHFQSLRLILVSILVFVELALGPQAGRSCARCAFQSLFSWNLPSDWATRPGSRRRSEVSILVFVELALGPEPTSAKKHEKKSFNPCFRGTCPRTS